MLVPYPSLKHLAQTACQTIPEELYILNILIGSKNEYNDSKVQKEINNLGKKKHFSRILLAPIPIGVSYKPRSRPQEGGTCLLPLLLPSD